MPAAAIALNRFGLGARAADAPPADPKGWLMAQLEEFEPRPADFASLPQRRVVAAQLATYLEELRGLRIETRRAERPARARPAMAGDAAMSDQPSMSGDGGMPSRAAPDPNDELAGLPQQLRRYIRGEARSTYLALVAARANAAPMPR